MSLSTQAPPGVEQPDIPLQSIPESQDDEEPNETALERRSMSRSQALNLYTSHLLSTWNARTYEFAAVSLSVRAFGLMDPGI
jgi:solute carrier family 40 (iron-regulated transporter), member 1